jgi:chromosome segregation ATPase
MTNSAPTQTELNDYQARAQKANLAMIRANALVAQADENLAEARLQLSRAQTEIAKLNVEGTLLQQRVQADQQATQPKIAVPRLARA